MSKVYQDILSLIDVEIDEEEKARINKYIKKFQMWRVIMYISAFVACGVAIYGISRGVIWGFLTFVVPFFIMSKNKALRKSEADRVRFIINEKCDAGKALSAYVCLTGKGKQKGGWEALLYNICATLNYAGRTEDCEKIMTLFDKYCNNKVGMAYKKLLQISNAYQAQDAEKLNKYVEEMNALIADKKVMMVMQVASQRAYKYPALLEAEQKGDYEAVHEMLDPNDEIDPRLKLVTDYYRLYKVAKVAGMEEVAAEHRAFVLENGGDTYYKKELV